MPTNQFGQYYSGNDDFRGFLAGQNSVLVPYVGNDGGVNQNKLTSNAFNLRMQGIDPTSVRKTVSDMYSSWNAARQTNNTTNNNGSVYGGGGGSSVDWNTVNTLNQGIGTIQGALDRLPGQLDIAKGNILKQFSQRDNELNSGFNQSKNTYDTSSTQNQQSLRTNKNSINDMASGGLRGLLRMLGSYGAVGSDLTLAGRAVSDKATQQNADASQTFAQNQVGLDTNWGNYKNSFENEKKKLTDWQSQQLNSAEAQSLTTRQNLLASLAELRGKIASARGGNYAGAAQPYLDQASALNSRIDQLGALNPTYTGVTPVYTAPSLASYNIGGNRALIAAPQQQTDSGTPYLSLLLNQDEKNKQPLIG